MYKFLLLFISGLLLPLICYAQDLDTTMWVTDGYIKAIAHGGSKVYIGGSFDYIGPNTGGGAAVNPVNGQLATPRFSYVHGDVKTAVSDEKGGWFIGGKFTSVQGAARHGLAHILSDGTLDPDWVFNTEKSGTFGSVGSLVVHDGVLFIGGHFDKIGGINKNYFAGIV